MKTIHYLSTERYVIRYLTNYFAQFKYRLTALNFSLFDSTSISEVQYLLIVEPLMVHDIGISVYTLWKTYLVEHNPDCQLIVLGIKDLEYIQYSNYLDILRLPKDFCAFLKQTKSVQETWAYIPTDVVDMRMRMKRFFKGHGEEDMTKELIENYRKLSIFLMDMIEEKEEKEPIQLDSTFKKNWRTLLNRWKNYFPLFDFLPYYPQLIETNETIKKLNELMQEKELWEEELELLMDLLYEINQTFKTVRAYG